jgi:RNA polymerase sigma-70 factor (ECF subfamily)
MDEADWLAVRFEEQRAHLRAVAYRMLGSLTEADDAVQNSWLRLAGTGTADVENLAGWLTTVVARECLKMLRARRGRREEPLGVHVPDPIISSQDGADPEQEALLADSVGLALLVVLDTLAPAERLAFVLHDMFDVPFDEIAPIVGRTPAAARQAASRVRRRIKGAAPVPDADLARQQEVVGAFLGPPATGTSRRWSRRPTRTSCSAPTSARCLPGHRGWSAALRPWPGRRCPSGGGTASSRGWRW